MDPNNPFSFDTSLLGSSSDPTQTDALASVTPPVTAPVAQSASDSQSNAFVNLLGTLGTAAIGAATAQPTTAVNSAGKVVSTAPTATAPLIPGVSNQTLVLGLVALVGAIVLVQVIRR